MQNVRLSFPDIKTVMPADLGDGKFRHSATMTISKKHARQLQHRFQMRAICAELGRENYPSRQTMRRVALRMLKDARRPVSRTVYEYKQRIDKNKDWMRFVTDTVEESVKIGRADIEAFMQEMHEKLPETDPTTLVMSEDTFNTIANTKPLDKMTAGELLEYGRGIGAKVTTKMKKADLIDAINAAL